MFIIFLQFALTAVGLFLAIGKEKDLFVRSLSFICITSIICVTGLRWKTGTDWNSYQTAYEIVSSKNLHLLGGTFEFLYVQFLYISAIIYDNFTFALILQSAFIVISIAKAAKFVRLPVVMFVAVVFLDQSQFWYPVRQQLGVAFIILSFCMVFSRSASRGRDYCAAFIALLNPLIHIGSSISSIVLIFFVNTSFRVKFIFFCAVCIFVFFYFPIIMSLFIQSRFETYIVENVYEFDQSRTYLRILERLITFFLVGALLIRMRRVGDIGVKEFYMVVLFFVIGTIGSAMLLATFPYLARATSYFSWIVAIIIVTIIHDPGRKYRAYDKLIAALCLVVYSFKFTISIFAYRDLLDPYFFVWESVSRAMY